MSFKTFMSAFWGAMVGKIVIGIFLAVCALLGFGPEKWAAKMIVGLPQWITPAIAQWGFLGLGLATTLAVFRPWNWGLKWPAKADAKIVQDVPIGIVDSIRSRKRFIPIIELRDEIKKLPGWDGTWTRAHRR